MNQEIPKNAIIYCRVSSKDQLEGTSLETQERLAKEYAEKQGLNVLKIFVERGESVGGGDFEATARLGLSNAC